MTKKKRKKSILYASVCTLIILVLAVLYMKLSGSAITSFSNQEKKINILLNDDYIVSDPSDAIKIDGSTLVILKGGKYKIHGSLEDGRIVVDAGKDEKVTLKLDDVDIHCEDSAPLWIKSAKRVVLRMEKGSENVFSDGSLYASEPDGVKTPNGCICSKANLTIKGEGASLVVRGNYKNGVTCSDDIDIKSGSLDITALKTAIKCKENLTVLDGTVSATAGKDGIYCNGIVDLQKGKVQIDASRYGIFAYDGTKTADGVQVNIKNARSDMAGIREDE